MTVKANSADRFHPSSKLYAVLNYNYVLFPLTQLLTYYALFKIAQATWYYAVVSHENTWHWTTAVHFLLNAIFVVSQFPPYANVWGMCLPIRTYKKKEAIRRRPFQTLRICLVTKGTNFQTVLTSTSRWSRLKHPSLQFHVLVDGGNGLKFKEALPSYIHIDDVPDSFKPTSAKYKARALEFFRRKHSLTKSDWVLHLDEESEIDEYVIETCLDFIERGTAEVGMGTIFYNGANHWKNAFLSTGEVMRIADDFGRFQLPVRLLQRPLLGWMHGSWILINGEVENSVTWDTACIAEDFWFAYRAASLGYKFGWLHAIVREQPPCTFKDFLKQRRRWYTGILSIDSAIVRFMLTASILGVACFYMFPLYGLLGYRIPMPKWYFYWILWNDATNVHALLASSIMQDMTMTDISWMDIALNALKAVALSPLVHLMQTVALISSWIQPSQGFKVIEKI